MSKCFWNKVSDGENVNAIHCQETSGWHLLYGLWDWHSFGANLKWPSEELQFGGASLILLDAQ